MTSLISRSASVASFSSTILTTPASSTTLPRPLGSSGSATSTVAPTPAERCRSTNSPRVLSEMRGPSPLTTRRMPSWSSAMAAGPRARRRRSRAVPPAGRRSRRRAARPRPGPPGGQQRRTSPPAGGVSSPRSRSSPWGCRIACEGPSPGWTSSWCPCRPPGPRRRSANSQTCTRTISYRSCRLRRLGRQDSNLRSRDQNPVPCHLATPQYGPDRLYRSAFSPSG